MLSYHSIWEFNVLCKHTHCKHPHVHAINNVVHTHTIIMQCNIAHVQDPQVNLVCTVFLVVYLLVVKSASGTYIYKNRPLDTMETKFILLLLWPSC